MKKCYSEEQIIKAIKQHEAGGKVEDICRELGISKGTVGWAEPNRLPLQSEAEE